MELGGSETPGQSDDRDKAPNVSSIAQFARGAFALGYSTGAFGDRIERLVWSDTAPRWLGGQHFDSCRSSQFKCTFGSKYG